MKIIINSSTLKGTGVVQVASSFINECASIPENEYIVFLSPKVSENVKKEAFPSNFRFYEFGESSLYSLRGRKDIKKMKAIEKEEKPDVVFSVFGPSLWKPRAPHLQGFAFPHYIYHESPLYDILTIKERIHVKLKESVHMHCMLHEAQYFVCETDDVAERLCNQYSVRKEKVYRVYNTASAVFLDYKHKDIERGDNEFRFFTLCSPYKHKNLAILNSVIPIIKRMGLTKEIKFYTTFKDEDFNRIFKEGVRDMIVNVGPQTIAECPSLVEKCDALFLPTLLECYSASYPEAMCMRKPIITSKLSFAETVCNEAALYFDPLSAEDIADTIKKIVETPSLAEELRTKGEERLKEFGTAHDRALQYLSICQEIVSKIK